MVIWPLVIYGSWFFDERSDKVDDKVNGWSRWQTSRSALPWKPFTRCWTGWAWNWQRRFICCSWLFFDFPRPLLAKRGSTSPCIPSPQAREKLRISRIPHSQSSGIAREACALKGERCVFYEMGINLEVFNLETDFFGDQHCNSCITDMLCGAQAQYGDYSELEKCPMWGCGRRKGKIRYWTIWTLTVMARLSVRR